MGFTQLHLNKEVLDKDLIKVSPGASGKIQIVDRDPTDHFDLAEVHTFTISNTQTVTINSHNGSASAHSPRSQPPAGQTRIQAKRPDSLPLVPSRQVRRRRGVRWASS